MSSRSDQLEPPASPSASQAPSSSIANASQPGANSLTMSLPPPRVLPSTSKRRGSSGNFFCAAGCGSSFKSQSNLKDHIMNVHQIFPPDRVVLRCTRGCGKGFTRKSDFQKHLERKTRCDQIKPNSTVVVSQQFVTSLSLEQRAKLLDCVTDSKSSNLHRQKLKSMAPTARTAGLDADKQTQLSPPECDSVPTQSLYVSGNETTDHIQQSPGIEPSVAVNPNVCQDQPFDEKPYSNQSIEDMSRMERSHPQRSATDRIPYRQPLLPVQTNVSSGRQAYRMDPVPEATSLARMHLQGHPYQIYSNEYTRQSSTYLPYNVEMRPSLPALTVNHQIRATHQRLGDYSLFGQAQTTQVFSQQLPSYEQPAQNTDTLHCLTLQRSLVADAGSAQLEMPTSLLYNQTLPGIRHLSQPFRPRFDREGGSEDPRAYCNGESNDTSEDRYGQSMGTVANRKFEVPSRDLPWTPQSCAHLPPSAPYVLSSKVEYNAQVHGSLQHKREWAYIRAAVDERHSLHPPTQPLPMVASTYRPAFPLPAPSMILKSTSTPRMQRLRNVLHTRLLSRDSSTSIVSDRDGGIPASPNRGHAASGARKGMEAKLKKERGRSSTIISLEIDPDLTEQEYAEMETDSDVSQESGSWCLVDESLPPKEFS